MDGYCRGGCGDHAGAPAGDDSHDRDRKIKGDIDEVAVKEILQLIANRRRQGHSQDGGAIGQKNAA